MIIKSTRAMILVGLLSFFSSVSLVAGGLQKELPLLVTIRELLTDSSKYDGHRVVTTGRVRSMEGQIGRRGSEYVLLVLEDAEAGAIEPIPSIQVISLTLPPVREGHHALVQGAFHKEGKQAGRSFEYFIDAEVILREKL